jgi:hypothetical protein
VIMDMVWRLVAVAVAAVAGGLGTGALVQTGSQMAMQRKLPPWLARIFRLVGGAAVGFLAALGLLGGGGGWGFGFGGAGAGAGSGTNSGPVALVEKHDAPQTEVPAVSVSEVLRIEVLGDPALARMVGKQFDGSRCYRVETDGQVRMLTLAEIKDMLRKRQEVDPPLRKVVLTLYNDSPDKDVLRVSELRRWVEDELPPRASEKVVVDVESLGQDAPAK